MHRSRWVGGGGSGRQGQAGPHTSEGQGEHTASHLGGACLLCARQCATSWCCLHRFVCARQCATSRCCLHQLPSSGGHDSTGWRLAGWSGSVGSGLNPSILLSTAICLLLCLSAAAPRSEPGAGVAPGGDAGLHQLPLAEHQDGRSQRGTVAEEPSQDVAAGMHTLLPCSAGHVGGGTAAAQQAWVELTGGAEAFRRTLFDTCV